MIPILEMMMLASVLCRFLYLFLHAGVYVKYTSRAGNLRAEISRPNAVIWLIVPRRPDLYTIFIVFSVLYYIYRTVLYTIPYYSTIFIVKSWDARLASFLFVESMPKWRCEGSVLTVLPIKCRNTTRYFPICCNRTAPVHRFYCNIIDS